MDAVGSETTLEPPTPATPTAPEVDPPEDSVEGTVIPPTEDGLTNVPTELEIEKVITDHLNDQFGKWTRQEAERQVGRNEVLRSSFREDMQKEMKVYLDKTTDRFGEAVERALKSQRKDMDETLTKRLEPYALSKDVNALTRRVDEMSDTIRKLAIPRQVNGRDQHPTQTTRSC